MPSRPRLIALHGCLGVILAAYRASRYTTDFCGSKSTRQLKRKFTAKNTSKSVSTSVAFQGRAVGALAVKEEVRMRFEDRTYETQLAKAEWLLEQAARWNDRDPKFADLLRMKARLILRSEDEKANVPVRRLA